VAAVLVVWVAFTDPVCLRLRHPANYPLSSTALVVALLGTVVGTAWWQFAVSGKPIVSWRPPELPSDCATVHVTFGSGGQMTSGKKTSLGWSQRFDVQTLKMKSAEFTNPVRNERAIEIWASIIKLQLRNNRVFADVTVYAPSPLKSIKITKEKISTLPDGWDSNHNNNTLEIVDERENPIYQYNIFLLQGIIR
jgi:hypothetical protein